MITLPHVVTYQLICPQFAPAFPLQFCAHGLLVLRHGYGLRAPRTCALVYLLLDTPSATWLYAVAARVGHTRLQHAQLRVRLHTFITLRIGLHAHVYFPTHAVVPRIYIWLRLVGLRFYGSGSGCYRIARFVLHTVGLRSARGLRAPRLHFDPGLRAAHTARVAFAFTVATPVYGHYTPVRACLDVTHGYAWLDTRAHAHTFGSRLPGLPPYGCCARLLRLRIDWLVTDTHSWLPFGTRLRTHTFDYTHTVVTYVCVAPLILRFGARLHLLRTFPHPSCYTLTLCAFGHRCGDILGIRYIWDSCISACGRICCDVPVAAGHSFGGRRSLSSVRATTHAPGISFIR